MSQNNLRTYRRRSVTRTSGHHVIEGSTGGQCIIMEAEKYTMSSEKKSFVFFRDELEMINLFEMDLGILAFGGYIYTNAPIAIDFHFSYNLETEFFEHNLPFSGILNENDWNNIGFHREISMEIGTVLKDVKVEMIVTSKQDTILEFISFDLDVIKKEEFSNNSLYKSFHQKTAMHIPYLYYLNTNLDFNTYLENEIHLEPGNTVVLKSCNRCGRYNPINIFKETSTLAYSLHCKKNAPCKHSTFSCYEIMNLSDLTENIWNELSIVDNKLNSFHGHQLECKACKKFFVNAPLNPQRNPQQFKEDGLRRRAIEVLVNNLLDTNLVHFEFEKKTRKEFSEYIWKKFDKKCFKCKKEIQLDEMHLDHTMPLAYLYRLDESATCLCSQHNSQKSDRFPVEFYTKTELQELSYITNLSLDVLTKKGVNEEVLELLIEKVDWFYDTFLMNSEYQKIRDGIKTADKINDSLKRVIGDKVDLMEEYKKRTNHYPNSVTSVEIINFK